MKIKFTGNPEEEAEFNPINMNITLESQRELDIFAGLFNDMYSVDCLMDNGFHPENIAYITRSLELFGGDFSEDNPVFNYLVRYLEPYFPKD